MSHVPGTSGIDETHGGLQKLYFVCFSNPARPPAELEANLEAHKAYLGKLDTSINDLFSSRRAFSIGFSY